MKSADLEDLGNRARTASRTLATVDDHLRSQALYRIADGLESRYHEVLVANEQDIQSAKGNDLGDAAIDRLRLDGERLGSIAGDVRTIASLPDPLEEAFDAKELPNGIKVAKRRTPLGVIGVIYESRPNVTIDISALCMKSGNAVILKGGSEALQSNTALVNLVKASLVSSEIPVDAVQFIASSDRALVGHMLGMKDQIDLMVPRGSASLVHRVASEATMPAITGGVGVCHMYVDSAAELGMTTDLIHNSKVVKPYVCNAIDTILVHSSAASTHLPKIASVLGESGVELRCDPRSFSILGDRSTSTIIRATDLDWGVEFLSLRLAVKVVDSLGKALSHIDLYGSGHTDAIITEDSSAATRFLNEVDSSVVIVNTSTRYNDGGRLGLGAEVAISTNKLHARGPMGLKELTSYKWTVVGEGQVPA